MRMVQVSLGLLNRILSFSSLRWSCDAKLLCDADTELSDSTIFLTQSLASSRDALCEFIGFIIQNDFRSLYQISGSSHCDSAPF
mmetsp:Transcript_39233/g.82163  ORF Transcript_39233/g.82163 Transcript_39233/m.82163 type:complete len:84 (-) Transcript_39233:16-267(-)